MNDLPPGWVAGTLGDFAKPVRVGIDPASVPDLPYLGLEHVQAQTTNILGSALASSVRSTSYEFDPGATLFARLRPYLNKVCTPTFKGVGSGEFITFPARTHLAPGFLKYLLNQPAFVEFTATLDTGDRPRVNWSGIRDFPCALPPLAEQERIVAMLEEHFSRLDAGVAALERARQNLKLMRIAVLDAAAAGRLVRDEETTPKRRIGEVIESLDQGWSPRCKRIQASEGEWAVIKTSAVQVMRFDDSANKCLPPMLEPREGLEILPGDLLVTRAGPRARAGVCCLVRDTRQRLMICDKVYRFRPVPGAVLPEYLELVLNAPMSVSAIDRIKTGISDSGVNITQSTFRALEIPVPSIKKQSEIVQVVGEQLARISEVDVGIDLLEVRGRQLRSSVLSAAFSGKLAPQDPATVLLERVVAERVSTNGSRPAKAFRRRRTKTVA